jgi:hypothetical protein
VQNNENRWLIALSTIEIRAHRLLYFATLVPILGLWLPYALTQAAITVAMSAVGSAVGLTDTSDTVRHTDIALVGSAIPICAFIYGLVQEFRRQSSDDKKARSTALPMPGRQGAVLLEDMASIWRSLETKAGSRVPGVILQRSLGITAHAYDDRAGQNIEVSPGLATRIVHKDPLALSIVRHEMAHLVHKDLPAIKMQASAASAANYAMTAALIACTVASILVFIMTNFVKFPLDWTFGNFLSVNMVIVLALFIATLPLSLGLFVVSRYAGFLVALVEARADISAGLWGSGLQEFARAIERDPSVKTSTIREIGLAYISPWLSHLPNQERMALLRDPERVVTPKLRYFMVTIFAIWLLTFHQGDAVWDFFLLCVAVAIVQSVTVWMALESAGKVCISALTAFGMAVGILVCQSLPLISVEGLAYLSQHLTAAIVRPGGFGSPDGASYLQDVVDVFTEFTGHVGSSTGGFLFILAIFISTVAFLILYALSPSENSVFRKTKIYLVSILTFLLSITVSYRFFQKDMYRFVRNAAFEYSDLGQGQASTYLGQFFYNIGQEIAKNLWLLSEYLNGPAMLSEFPWLRICIPQMFTLVAVIFLWYIIEWIAKLAPMNGNRRIK